MPQDINSAPPEGMSQMEYDQAVEALLPNLKKSFLSERNRRVGDKNIKKNTRVDERELWRIAADGCLRHEADPCAYIQAAFNASMHHPDKLSIHHLSYEGMKNIWQQAQSGSTCATDTDDDIRLVLDTGDKILEGIIASARNFLMKRIGHVRPEEETFYVLRRSMFLGIGTLARVHFGYTDQETMDLYAEEARTILFSRPDLKGAAEKFEGFPYAELMSYTRTRNERGLATSMTEGRADVAVGDAL